MTDREELHRLLNYTAGTQVDTTCQEMDSWDLATKLFTQSGHNERFPRFAQHLPFDQRDAIVQTILGAVAPSSPAPHSPTPTEKP